MGISELTLKIAMLYLLNRSFVPKKEMEYSSGDFGGFMVKCGLQSHSSCFYIVKTLDCSAFNITALYISFLKWRNPLSLQWVNQRMSNPLTT